MIEQPLVSVFIPYYNDEKYLKQSIESVLNQTYENFELILLNHATTDSCREIAHSYNDSRIKHIDMDKNYGGGSGILFEKLLNASGGKYIKTLCADDILRNDGLEKLVEYMENNPDIDFAFGNVEYINEKSEDLNDNFFNTRENFSVKNTEADCLRLYSKGISFLPYIGAIIKREALSDILFNKTYIMLFDMSLWVSLLAKGCKIGYLDELVCNYRIHDGQVSAVKNEGRVATLSYFETKTFYKYFLSISDIDLAKQIWPESRFADKLKYKEDIPFYVAHNFLITHCPFESSFAYLDSLLNNKELSERLDKIFNYSVKELREDILNYNNSSNMQKVTFSAFQLFKNKIYSTPVKELRTRNLLFLYLRRLCNAITFYELRKKKKKKKKYSL